MNFFNSALSAAQSAVSEVTEVAQQKLETGKPKGPSQRTLKTGNRELDRMLTDPRNKECADCGRGRWFALSLLFSSSF